MQNDVKGMSEQAVRHQWLMPGGVGGWGYPVDYTDYEGSRVALLFLFFSTRIIPEKIAQSFDRQL